MASKKYTHFKELKADEINFALGTDRHGKATIQMYIGETAAEVAMVSPACVTNWPRVFLRQFVVLCFRLISLCVTSIPAAVTSS